MTSKLINLSMINLDTQDIKAAKRARKVGRELLETTPRTNRH